MLMSDAEGSADISCTYFTDKFSLTLSRVVSDVTYYVSHGIFYQLILWIILIFWLFLWYSTLA